MKKLTTTCDPVAQLRVPYQAVRAKKDQASVLAAVRREQRAAYRIIEALLPLSPQKRAIILNCALQLSEASSR